MESVESAACTTSGEVGTVVDDATKRRVIALRADNKSLRAIATDTGISHATVRQILKDAGEDTSEAPRRDTTERDERVVALYTDPERPLDVQGVSDATGISFNTVRGILSRAGVIRERGPAAGTDPKRNRSAIPYRPSDETRADLELYARENGLSLDAAIDKLVSDGLGDWRTERDDDFGL